MDRIATEGNILVVMLIVQSTTQTVQSALEDHPRMDNTFELYLSKSLTQSTRPDVIVANSAVVISIFVRSFVISASLT
jgi:hypothetical protein